MEKKILTIPYDVYTSAEELEEKYHDLLQAATESTHKAYAPYSNFYVGASLLLKSGKIVTGANQENASFPIGMCAERVAIFRYSMNDRNDPVLAVAVTALSKHNEIKIPPSPCGACRQALKELEINQEDPIELFLQSEKGLIFRFDSVSDILPMGFDPSIFFKI